MRILSEDFVNNWFNKQLNIHPSLLPDFKGLDVHKRVIESKTNISGCTVHLVRAGVDEGPIIGQISTKVESNDNEEMLAGKVLKLEHILYPVCLKLFSDNLIQINEDKIIYSKEAIDQLDEINARLGKYIIYMISDSSKKYFISSIAVSEESEPCTEFASIDRANCFLIVPSSASSGFVAPMISLFFRIAFSPSKT